MSKTLKFRHGWVFWGLLFFTVQAWGMLPDPARERCVNRYIQETAAQRLPWATPPRSIPGYVGPEPDASGSYEARQVQAVAHIYQRLALDESSLDIFAIAQSDANIREISFHLVDARYSLGLNSLVDLETKPIFIVQASCIARMADKSVALLLNPSHWETDPNLSFAASATALYVMDRLVRGRHIKGVRHALGETIKNYVYGADEIREPDDHYVKRDPIERLYSRLYSELVFMELYGKWTRRDKAQMKTEELEGQYDHYWMNPEAYLMNVAVSELQTLGYRDDALNQIVAASLLIHPLPEDWPLPHMPNPNLN
ncbi:MAG: hypothetical protein R3B54_04685 [Bdellovibrionota bacterium]